MQENQKEDFPHKLPCLLIYPSKSDIGKISKHVLNKVNQKLLSVTEVNKWKDSLSVIEWFKNIRNKVIHHFLYLALKTFTPRYR